MNFDKKTFFLYLIFFFAVTGVWQRFIVNSTVIQKRFLMNTQTEIRAIGRNKSKLEKAINQAFERIRQIESRANFFNPNSELSQINYLAKYQKTAISSDLYQIVSASIQGSQISQGYFDITATPLTKMFHNREIKKTTTKQTVGYQYLELSKVTENYFIKFNAPDLELDLGGVAKGYAIDQAVQVLKQAGIKNALISCGSSIYGFGRPWKIGIKDPNNTSNITEIITLKNQGLATSGDYEQFYYSDRGRICHIVNPRQGLITSKGDFSSVTVVAKDATLADILSTGAFSMGKEKALQILPTKNIRIIFK